MEILLIKLAVAFWFIAICIEISFRLKAWTEDHPIQYILWGIKSMSYLAAFVSTILLIATA